MPLARRIITCLDCDLAVPQGRVIKGIRFKRHVYAGDPAERAMIYYEQGADEITFLDVTASHHRRETMAHVVERTTDRVFIPVTVGGGIRRVEDFVRMLRAGADKCSTTTHALKNPGLITQAARVVGSQAVVVSIDAQRHPAGQDGDRIVIDTPMGPSWYECWAYGGREGTGVDAIAWAVEAEDRGAGELLLNSIEMDGMKTGYDWAFTKAVSDRVGIPVIASGGCGEPQHFLDAFKRGNADAALAASIFHFDSYTVGKVKEYLVERGVPVRRLPGGGPTGS
jgi:cyclase